MRSIGAIILAAGASSRFGSPKQLALVDGETLVRRAVKSALAAGCDPIIVVAGQHAQEIAWVLGGTNAQVIENSQWHGGMGASIKAGVSALLQQLPGADAALLMTCDQPWVTAEMLHQLITVGTPDRIIASTYAGTVGIPALFPVCRWHLLLSLPDAQGAKALLTSSGASVNTVAMPEAAFDLDYPEDLASLIPAIRH